MTKKHFVAVAGRISEIKDMSQRESLANWFCEWFGKYNKLFQKDLFLKACSIENNLPMPEGYERISVIVRK